MSTKAKPTQTLYLRMASPTSMARAASLCPAGTWRLTKPSLLTSMPMPTSTRATTTLSAGCSLFTGPLMRLADGSIMG